jgi:hypothetical protein
MRSPSDGMQWTWTGYAWTCFFGFMSSGSVSDDAKGQVSRRQLMAGALALTGPNGGTMFSDGCQMRMSINWRLGFVPWRSTRTPPLISFLPQVLQAVRDLGQRLWVEATDTFVDEEAVHPNGAGRVQDLVAELQNKTKRSHERQLASLPPTSARESPRDG